MPSRLRPLPAGFIAPCLPSRAPRPPYGAFWLHQIKHDGFRAIARKDGVRVKIYSRPGNELTHRFPLLVEALARLRARSCIIDGEAVACGEDGIALFERIRYRRHDESVFMWAFDLIELNGEDLRREQLEQRKAALARLLARAAPGLRFNEHLERFPIRLTRKLQGSWPEPAAKKKLRPKVSSGKLFLMDSTTPIPNVQPTPRPTR